MKPDKGDWLEIINVFAANGLGGRVPVPLSSGGVRGRKSERKRGSRHRWAAVCVGLDHSCHRSQSPFPANE